jgi:hypothetical protein
MFDCKHDVPVVCFAMAHGTVLFSDMWVAQRPIIWQSSSRGTDLMGAKFFPVAQSTILVVSKLALLVLLGQGLGRVFDG